MLFTIDAASHVPIHRQLAQQIRLAVARGRLRTGERVPSVRELSRHPGATKRRRMFHYMPKS